MVGIHRQAEGVASVPEEMGTRIPVGALDPEEMMMASTKFLTWGQSQKVGKPSMTRRRELLRLAEVVPVRLLRLLLCRQKAILREAAVFSAPLSGQLKLWAREQWSGQHTRPGWGRWERLWSKPLAGPSGRRFGMPWPA